MSLPVQTLATNLTFLLPVIPSEEGIQRLGLLFIISLLGFSPALKEVKGGTPLHQAIIKQADVGYIKQLCKYVNEPDKHGTTPLHLAAKRWNVALLKLLLAHQGDVTAKNRDGETPLHLAVGEGNIPIIRHSWKPDQL